MRHRTTIPSAPRVYTDSILGVYDIWITLDACEGKYSHMFSAMSYGLKFLQS